MTDTLRGICDALLSGWRPWVEIALLAVALYGVFRLLGGRGRTGVPAAAIWAWAGAAVLLAGLEAAGLHRFAWVFEKILALAAVGALVVYRDDVRAALSPMGGRPFPRAGARPLSVPDEVAGAALALARGGAGALVAFEGRDSLEAYAAGGVRLDADVSRELLTGLFAPGSPLRDGAAIVRGGKVAAAGCLLPLTERPEAAKSLGTRHRAALGLVEITDAVTVAVSSETAKVSVGHRAELRQGLSPDELRETLRELLPG